MTATTGLTRLAAAPSMVHVAVDLAVIYVVWGSTYGAIRLLVEDMPPLVSPGLRFRTASILVVIGENGGAPSGIAALFLRSGVRHEPGSPLATQRHR